MEVQRALAKAAVCVASDVKADAILLQTDTGSVCDYWLESLVTCGDGRPKLIIVTSNSECFEKLAARRDLNLVKVPAWQAGRMARVGQLVAHSLQEGYVSHGQRLVCLLGDGFPDSTDLIKVCSVTGEENVTDIFFNKTLTATVELSIELALARVNGEPIGVAFMIGDVESVLMHSYSLMPDPFPGSHANIKDKKQWELVKKYAASFDGAFVIDSDGTIVAAQRHLIANRRCDIPPGLGTRHHAVAAMTAVTAAKGVTVSQEDGFVRVFEKGRVVAKVNPASHVVECFKDSQ